MCSVPLFFLNSAGNRLWEWFSVGRYGTKGFNYHAQQFEGEEWPQELGEWLLHPVVRLSCTPCSASSAASAGHQTAACRLLPTIMVVRPSLVPVQARSFATWR